MHSHFGLQEQSLLAAPLIIREESAIKSHAQEVVVFLEDFSWTSPEEIFAGLKKGTGMSMGCGNKAAERAGPDLNDVIYDAYLANERTLDDPDIVAVERGGEVRLRIINGSASTNFTIDLGVLKGTLVAVDGNPIAPLVDSRFPLAVAQRADIMLRMPSDGRAVAIVALGEGRKLRAGVVLRPPGANVAKMSATTDAQGPQVLLDQELRLKASVPLPAKAVDRSIPVDLTGNMQGYVWGMPIHDTGGLPAVVERGERVELVIRNTTPMAHPMHLHGHLFQVSEIDGTNVAGAMRDTIHLPPKASVKVVFDADNPGLCAFHCHNLYHKEAGMFATLVYGGFA
jgi:FtsP/CotA-like multicopper oxidase with cupredoxin domain